MHMHYAPKVMGENFLNNLRPVPIVPSQGKMDQVGFEPTTSAMPVVDRKKLVQISAASSFFLWWFIAYAIKQSFEKLLQSFSL